MSIVGFGEAEMAIGDGLHRCLAQLQKIEGYERSWVDAISLSQVDLEERSASLAGASYIPDRLGYVHLAW